MCIDRAVALFKIAVFFLLERRHGVPFEQDDTVVIKYQLKTDLNSLLNEIARRTQDYKWILVGAENYNAVVGAMDFLLKQRSYDADSSSLFLSFGNRTEMGLVSGTIIEPKQSIKHKFLSM